METAGIDIRVGLAAGRRVHCILLVISGCGMWVLRILSAWDVHFVAGSVATGVPHAWPFHRVDASHVRQSLVLD